MAVRVKIGVPNCGEAWLLQVGAWSRMAEMIIWTLTIEAEPSGSFTMVAWYPRERR